MLFYFQKLNMLKKHKNTIIFKISSKIKQRKTVLHCIVSLNFSKFSITLCMYILSFIILRDLISRFISFLGTDIEKKTFTPTLIPSTPSKNINSKIKNSSYKKKQVKIF